MSQFQYNGESERVIASLGIVVNQGDKFEAPEDFSAYDFLPVNAKKITATTPEPTVGE